MYVANGWNKRRCGYIVSEKFRSPERWPELFQEKYVFEKQESIFARTIWIRENVSTSQNLNLKKRYEELFKVLLKYPEVWNVSLWHLKKAPLRVDVIKLTFFFYDISIFTEKWRFYDIGPPILTKTYRSTKGWFFLLIHTSDVLFSWSRNFT